MADNNEKYLKLITSEHITKPLYKSYVKTFLDEISPTVNNLIDFNTLFDIDKATGDQLDKIGEIIGVSRVLPTDDANIPDSLSDDMYRRVIKSKNLANHWDGTRRGLEEIIEKMYPEMAYEITDNQDMSYMVLIINPTNTPEEVALLTNGYILPKPAGVRVNYQVLESGLFGWDSDTLIIKGWDSGVWANT